MTDQIALVTGASRGLGAALALALAPEYHVVAVARTVGGLEELDDRIKARGGSATLAPMDVTKRDAMAQLCRSIHDRWGKLALWAHTAVHAPPLSPADHVDAKDWDKTLATNVTATGILIPYVSPLLTATSDVLFFDDPAADRKFHGAYGASKRAQITLARAWAQEATAAAPNIHILTPNPMPTALRARFHPGEDREKLSHPDTEAARLLAAIRG
ncbi:SDR family NAD(P)-dependent oxidoreductase [Pseudooceanicola sp. LIPI14-2-Ac024]|uniref:SDR family NAD(P)-dependent oxidoreductase n=1 Tax=Pseudooceanicola sp. LIPI14-2-Ac024 TaxID=3344875 RepID=UPI0035CF00FC